MIRILPLLALLVVFAGCTATSANDPLAPMEEFKLGVNYVFAGKAQKGPVSRAATEEEWVAGLTKAIDDRFGQYQGSQAYDFGISVEGYLLAPKGVPIIYSPKSALIINVTVWDHATGKQLNPKFEQFTVFENTTGETFLIGSGRTRTKQEQIAGLSRNAVGRIEAWLLEQNKAEGWFAKHPEPGENDAGLPPLLKPEDG